MSDPAQHGPDLEALEEAYERGLAAERAGDAAAAAAAWRDCLAIDPADRGGAAVRLAALGQGPSPARASPAYVATLFDQHAESFEATLVLSLGPFARGLDLGCGTGLAGEALEDVVETMDGVDLSEGMLEIASEKEVYETLYAGDAVAFLERTPGPRYGLVFADPPYELEAMDRMPELAQPHLAPGGLFVLEHSKAHTFDD
ncbi:MAG: methyltransferase domain-containing protein, partial [Pseudomonadota bacterium]